jgi:HK97 family phage major capsid protein
MLNRAYSLLSIKSLDAEQRSFSGLATSPQTDRMGDVIEPLGVQFKNPLPLLLYHDTTKPVGHVTFGTPTADGIPFTASIPEITEPGTLKDRVDEAWQSAKYRLIRAVSIGFRPLHELANAVEQLKSGGLRFLKTEVLELSMVVIPANAAATISVVKSLDVGLAVPGNESAIELPKPAAVVASVVHPARKGAKAMTYAERIQALENTRAAKAAELDNLQKAVTDSGLTKDDHQRETFNGLVDDVKGIDAELADFRALEELNKKAAVPVEGKTPEQASANRGGSPAIHIKQVLPKGTLFTRYAMALAAGRGSISDAIAYAQRAGWARSSPEVVEYIRAVPGTAAGGSPSWGSELVSETNLASEFVELLRPATILGRITGIRNVPFNVRIPVQTGGSTVNWVGEAAPKPVSELVFDTITLGHDKIAGIVVLTDELVRLSTPSAEAVVRRDLVEQIARFMDAQFIDPTVTATDNNPASITNGVASPAASGTDADALYADLNAAFATFDNTDLGTNSIVILVPPALARGISTLRNPLGQFEFGGLSMAGGTLMGFPVLVSSAVPAGTIIIIKADEVLMADDGMVTLDASKEATLDMNGGSSPDFNLWQKNCVGIRAERWITWAKRRADAVAIIDTASYGPSVGSP